MKYLDIEELEAINASINFLDLGELRLFGRCECYSLKNSSEDKKLLQSIKNQKITSPTLLSTVVPSTSPSNNTVLIPTFSPSTSPSLLSSKISDSATQYTEIPKKTIFYLKATLNAAFPDYDFTGIPATSFQKILSITPIITSINSIFYNSLNSANIVNNATENIWTAIDSIICLAESEYFSYIPNARDGEPDSEDGGNLWSFYYFFFNKKQKKLVFFTCRAVSFLAPLQVGENPDLILDADDSTDGGHTRSGSEEDSKAMSCEEYIMRDME